jgi:hypothetical protein
MCQSPIQPDRDGRLDVLRGLCLLNMVVVHLIQEGMVVPWAVNEVVMHWLRFAAGGFILASGLCIGAIHYKKALDPAKRSRVYFSLLRRAGLVLLVHYFAAFLSLILVPLRYGYHEYDTWVYVTDVLYLYTGYDLLLFYVVMLVASPVLIELIRRFGVISVAIASGALFFFRYDHPYLPLYALENEFPVIRWQAVFIFGMLAGSKLTYFDVLTRSGKLRLLAITSALALGLAGVSAFERHTHLSLPWYLTVTKVPLSILEVVRYVGIVLSVGIVLDLCWSKVANLRATAVTRVIGSQSLLLWVAHVPIVAQLVPLNWVLAIAIAVPTVWGFATAGNWLSRRWSQGMPSFPSLPYAAPAMGSLLLIAILSNQQGHPQIVTDDRAILNPEFLPEDDAMPDLSAFEADMPQAS